MSQPYLGEIIMFGGNFAISGWAMCSGQLLPISQNTALFSILGTTFGGDGVQTFALPDLRGRVPVGAGNGNGLSPYVLGQQSGQENVTLTPQQLPAHTHTINAASVAGNQRGPGGNVLAKEATGQTAMYSNQTPDTTLAPSTVAASGGGNQPHSNIQPILAVTYLIALQGVFPSRN